MSDTKDDIEASIRDNIRLGVEEVIVPDLINGIISVIDDYYGVGPAAIISSETMLKIQQEEEQKIRRKIFEGLQSKESIFRAEIEKDLRDDLRKELLPVIREEIKAELIQKLYL
jgi:hypothetical protein